MAAPEAHGSRFPSVVGTYLELAKARLCLLVLVTTAVGYLLASPAGIDWPTMAWTLVGTALAAFGAGALNQCCEVARDAQMVRTQNRPLPARRLSATAAWAFALTCSAAGPAILYAFVNEPTAWLGLINILIYVGLYTPLKPVTPLNTLVGAFVGAIPPLMGWVGATGQVGAGGLVLAGILFVWQIPHFLALGWLYREDYARGGFRMLPVLDTTGHLTCHVMIVYSLLLVPLALAIVAAGLCGGIFATGSVALGLALLATVWQFQRERTRGRARRVFLASVIYLPLLLGLMVADRQPVATAGIAAAGPTVAPLRNPAHPPPLLGSIHP